MTADDLIQALQDAAKQPGGGEGFTSTELAEMSGLPISAVRRMLKPLVRDGRIRPARKTVQSMSGTFAPVPSYVLVEGTPPKPTP